MHYVAKYYTTLILKNAIKLSSNAYPVEEMAEYLCGEQFGSNKEKGEIIDGNAISIADNVCWVLSSMAKRSRIDGLMFDDIENLISKNKYNILAAHPEVFENEDSNHHFIDEDDEVIEEVDKVNMEEKMIKTIDCGLGITLDAYNNRTFEYSIPAIDGEETLSKQKSCKS